MITEGQNEALNARQAFARYWDKYRTVIERLFAPLTSGSRPSRPNEHQLQTMFWRRFTVRRPDIRRRRRQVVSNVLRWRRLSGRETRITTDMEPPDSFRCLTGPGARSKDSALIRPSAQLPAVPAGSPRDVFAPGFPSPSFESSHKQPVLQRRRSS